MSIQKHQPVILAKIGAPHGVRGDLRLHVFMEDPGAIFDFDPKDLLIEDRPSCFIPLRKFQMFDKGGTFYINFDDYKDRDLARRFVNKTLAIDRSLLPALAEDQVYWTDLEGLEVINQDNQVLGQIDHILETGANDVLVIHQYQLGPEGKISKEYKEYLVPYVDAHIKKIDLENKKIFVDWDQDF